MIFVVALDSRPGRLLASQLRFYRRRRHPRLRDVRHLRSRQHDARQRSERFHFRGYAGAALAGRRRERAARGSAGLLAAARRASSRFYGMGFDAYGLVALVVRERWRGVVDARNVGRSIARRAGTRAACAAARAVSQRPPGRARGMPALRPIELERLDRPALNAACARPASGSRVAASYLERHGLAVLARGYRCRLGELDLVCRDDGTLVVVEVRARSSGAFVLGRRKHRRAQASRASSRRRAIC